MAAAGGGLIVGVTDGIIDGRPPEDYQPGGLMWDVGHHCINRLMFDMAAEGKPHRIAVVTLMPGFMRTERVLMNLKTEEHKKMFRFDLSESVEHIGRAVAALAADADVLAKTGEIYFVADLAPNMASQTSMARPSRDSGRLIEAVTHSPSSLAVRRPPAPAPARPRRKAGSHQPLSRSRSPACRRPSGSSPPRIQETEYSQGA